MLFSDDNGILKDRQVHFRYRHLSVGNYPGFYHYHRGVEMLFVHRGRGHLVLNRKMYSLQSGCVLFIQPFQLHRLHFEVSDESPYERSVLNFEPTSVAPFFSRFPKTLRFFEHLWKEELSNQVFHLDDSDDYLAAVLERFHRKMSGPEDKNQLEGAAMMILQIIDCLQSLNESGARKSIPRTERHAEKIMQWVEENYMNPFDLGELAKALHLSRHHVSHLFRVETGSSITEYVIARRIRQACWLLKTESMPVERVGALVGIPHFSYFCRLFKRITGMTPKQYRDRF